MSWFTFLCISLSAAGIILIVLALIELVGGAPMNKG